MKEKMIKVQNRPPMRYVIGLSIALFILWILLSGKFEAKLLIMGALFSVFTAIISIPALTLISKKTGREFYLLEVKPFKFIGYSLWMFGQITLASIDVAKATLNKRLVEPRIIYFKMPFENPSAAALLSNSIIITPGTITLDVSDEGVFTVHALTKNAAEGLLEGTMQKKVAAVYGIDCEYKALPERTLIHIPKEVD